MGFIPFDHYGTATPATQYFPTSCPAGSSVRSCVQTLLGIWKQQRVSGVRILFAFCGGAGSTALTNCGTYNPPYSLNPTWIANVNTFFADVHAAGIQNVTITPSHAGTGGDTYAIMAPAAPPSGNRCADTTSTLRYWAAAPFGEKVCPGGSCGDGFPTGTDDNNGYNCSPKNPIFVGWQNLYNVISAMLDKATNNGLTVFELDAEQELDWLNFPVHARYIIDNAHTDTGNPDSVNSLRYYMGTAHTFDPGRVTWSTASDHATIAGTNCTDVYTDYARLLPSDEFASAIGGGVIGIPFGLSLSGGLACGGTTGGSPPMFQMPVAHTQPHIVDIHDYACVHNGSDCYASDSQAQITNESQIDFNDVVHYLALLNVQSSLFMLGETHSNSNNGSGYTCDVSPPGQSAPATAAGEMVTGYNSSSLAGHNVVFRPWFYLGGSCFSYPNNINVNLNNGGPYTPSQP